MLFRSIANEINEAKSSNASAAIPSCQVSCFSHKSLTLEVGCIFCFLQSTLNDVETWTLGWTVHCSAWFCFTIERLREILKLETKYRLNTDFRKSVIDVAQKEIKDLYERGGCDLWFDCDVSKKEGKRVLEYTFTIHGSRTKKIDSFDYQNTQSLINAINRSLKDIFPKDAKYIKSVIKEVHLRPDIAPVILRKINRIISGYPPFQVPGVLRYALKEDYQIK